MNRWILVVAGLFGVGQAIAAPPTVVVQSRSAGFLLDWVKAYARAYGGEDAIKELHKLLEDRLGEKGFIGLDLQRPLCGYGVLKPKREQTFAVVVLPVTAEKEFLDLLDRLKFEYVTPKETPGLYEITANGFGFNSAGGPETPWRFRFHDKHVYLGINAEKDDLAVKNLVPVKAAGQPG